MGSRRHLAVLVTGALAALAFAPAVTAAPAFTASTSAGGQITKARPVDTAVLTGATAPTGTITFDLFGPEDPSCAGPPLSSESVPVTQNGTYASREHYATRVGHHRWVARYSGDGQNPAVATLCADPQQAFELTKAVTQIGNLASPEVYVGGTISDAARVLGGFYEQLGSITFRLYGPADPTCTTPIASSTVEAVYAGAVNSEPFTATDAGAYRWVASYSGSAYDTAAEGTCGEPGSTVVVSPPPGVFAGATSLAFQPHGDVMVGYPATAQVALSAPSPASGALTFRFFGPDDVACARGAVSASTRAVLGSGVYASDPFVAPVSGLYSVTATFTSLDGSALSTPCGADHSTVRAADPPAPMPEFSKTFTVEGLNGTTVLVAPPPSARSSRAVGFVKVRAPRSVPIGSVVDARAGIAGVTTAVDRANVQFGSFDGAKFIVRQTKAGKGLTDLDLGEGLDRKICKKGARQGYGAKPKKGTISRKAIARLRSKAKGRFRTSGKHGRATVRGTEWEMTERCDGTLTRVISGTVDVEDNDGTKIRLKSGQKHLSKAK